MSEPGATLLLALAMALVLQTGARAADEPAQAQEQSEQPAEPPKCLQAVVNPVTGHAVCVNPSGAPVDPPSAEAFVRPCKPRAHDADPFTMYERYSGC